MRRGAELPRGAVNWIQLISTGIFTLHSGPTEKVQALHRSLDMADATTGKRFL